MKGLVDLVYVVICFIAQYQFARLATSKCATTDNGNSFIARTGKQASCTTEVLTQWIGPFCPGCVIVAG